LVVYFENGSGTNEEAAMSKKKWKTKTVTKQQSALKGHSQTGTLKLVVHTLDMRETRSGVCGWKEEEEKIERKPSSGW